MSDAAGQLAALRATTMHRKFIYLIWVPVLFMFAFWPVQTAFAQDLPSDVPSMELRLDSVTPIAQLSPVALVPPIRCDSSGNLYIRPFGPKIFNTPILKISPDGEKKASFSIDSSEGWQRGQVYDFAIERGGAMKLLAARATKERKVEFGVLSFDDDGQYRDSTTLKIALNTAVQFAVFPTGEYFVLGSRNVETSKHADKQPHSSAEAPEFPFVAPVAAVFNRNGDLIKEVRLSEGPPPDGNGTDDPSRQVPQSAVDLGSSDIGNDGNLYMSFQSPSVVYVINAEGIVVRTLTIHAPEKSPVVLGLANASALGLLLRFSKQSEKGVYENDAEILSLVNPETGERLYDYHVTSGLVTGTFACYIPKGMVFVGSPKDGVFSVLRARPH